MEVDIDKEFDSVQIAKIPVTVTFLKGNYVVLESHVKDLINLIYGVNGVHVRNPVGGIGQEGGFALTWEIKTARDR